LATLGQRVGADVEMAVEIQVVEDRSLSFWRSEH